MLNIATQISVGNWTIDNATTNMRRNFLIINLLYVSGKLMKMCGDSCQVRLDNVSG